jgi:hypothetical protein
VNAMKQIGLAVRMYSFANSNSYPTNFSQITNNLPERFDGGIHLDDFEFVSNIASMNMGKRPDRTVLVRERIARKTPEGKWVRVYGMRDGSVWEETSADGNFDAWEQDPHPHGFESIIR